MSDFSDDYFSMLRTATEPAPKPKSDRDVINPAALYGEQEQPRAQIVDANGGGGPGSPAVFTLANQWAQVLLLVPQQVQGYARLLAEGGPFYCGPEPFYVKGVRQFQNDTGSPLLVQTASRRELLSNAPVRDFPNNGAAFTDSIYEATSVGVVLALGQWAVLGSDGQWTAQTAGLSSVAADQFGFAAADKNKAGRYYEVEFNIVSSAGTAYLQTISQNLDGSNDWDGSAISQNVSFPRGVARVGDFQSAYTPTGAGVVVTGPNYAATFYSQANIQGRSKWSLAVRPSVAATVTISLKVHRQGF